ncbi:MAG: hypothetical protein WC521_00875 [Bdellovibrionales bacterium]|jgi:hypothetical protein
MTEINFSDPSPDAKNNAQGNVDFKIFVYSSFAAIAAVLCGDLDTANVASARVVNYLTPAPH